MAAAGKSAGEILGILGIPTADKLERRVMVLYCIICKPTIARPHVPAGLCSVWVRRALLMPAIQDDLFTWHRLPKQQCRGTHA